jgi:hypothetical protein
MMTLRATLQALEQTHATRWQRIAAAVRWFVLEADVQPTEVTGCLGAFYWALVLALPGDLFASSSGYAKLGAIFPERIWAGVSAVCAFMPMLALYLGSVKIRRLALQLHVWYYTTISVAIAAATPISTGIGIYALFALGASWAFWRLGARSGQRRR